MITSNTLSLKDYILVNVGGHCVGGCYSVIMLMIEVLALDMYGDM